MAGSRIIFMGQVPQLLSGSIPGTRNYIRQKD